MTLKPLNKHIVTKKIKEEPKTASGIVIATKDINHGLAKFEVVVDTDDYKKGNVILAPAWCGHEVTHEDQNYTIMPDDEPVAYLSK